MTLLFIVIFVLGPVLGYVYGVANDFSGIRIVYPIAVGGFLGSCIVALLFTYFYFFHEETDREKIKRITDEIDQIKREKKE